MILVYGADWCGDTRQAKLFLNENKISFKFFDTDASIKAKKFIEKVNKGSHSIPVIVFPDKTNARGTGETPL